MADNPSAPTPAPVVMPFNNPTRVRLRFATDGRGGLAEVTSIGNAGVFALQGRSLGAGIPMFWTNDGFYRPDQIPHDFDIVAVQHVAGGPFVEIYPYRTKEQVTS